MEEVGRGAKVFDHGPVRGRWVPMDGPDDVLALMDTGAEGVIALVRDAGATFLAPLYHELTAVVCTGGTPSWADAVRQGSSTSDDGSGTACRTTLSND